MYATIHTISPFDSTIGTDITFTWSGNQIYKVRCLIKNNTSGVTVYDQTVSTMKQSYTIPTTSGLVNGSKYLAYITVFGIDNTESTIQPIGTPFYCFTTPTFALSVSTDDVIRASSYEVSLAYSQTENEALNWFSINLYSYQKTQMQTSGTVYDVTDPSYIMTNLFNATQYYVRGIGETVNGMSLDTGFVLFTVSYEVTQIFSTLELNNISESGAIEIKSNIVSAEGIPEKDVTYIDGECVDLTDNSVIFGDGFEIDGDFSQILKFYKPKRNNVIIEFGTVDKLNVKIYYRQGIYSDSNGEKGYFELVANSCGINYIVNSNYVDILAGDYYYEYSLLINRKKGLFDLKALASGTLIRYSNSSDGSNMTTEKQPNSQYVGLGYMPRDVYEHENLYTGTKDFTGDWRNASSWSYNTETYAGFKVAQKTTRYSGLCKNLNGITGETYTFSAYINYSNKLVVNSAPTTGYSSGTNGTSLLTITKPVLSDRTNTWIRYYYNFVLGSDGIICPSFEPAINDEVLKVCGIKFERGSAPTDWTPAPSEWLADSSNYEWILI